MDRAAAGARVGDQGTTHDIPPAADSAHVESWERRPRDTAVVPVRGPARQRPRPHTQTAPLRSGGAR
jgi:hypothetical protein